ncbi:MAG: hypothetical protein NT093_02975 [Candidatus Moranbacteria bacterium]|nr:hypothetical protein [Candidatus Moranbacteria bacterium]
MSLEQFKQFKQPEASPEEITTPELVQKREAEYIQAEEALRRANEDCLKKADQIEDERVKKIVLARLGLVSVRLAEINQEVMVGLN